MKNKVFIRIFDIALSLVCLFGFSFTAFAQDNTENDNMTLRFKNGEFKILILSDIQDTNKPAKETKALLKMSIEKTKPDFIVLLGDNTAGWWRGVTPEETKEAIDIVAGTIDSFKIPFALVYGNHDHEGLCDEKNMMQEEEAKELMLSWYQNYDTCMAIEGEEMTGVGNYNIRLKSTDGNKFIYNLWFMDSNPYTPEDEGGGYGYVHEDQTAWYQRVSNQLKKENGGNPVPSLVFQHIIVPETYSMMTEVKSSVKGSVRGHGIQSDKHYIANPKYIYQGELNEGPCSPDVNHGQFESWQEQGDVVAGVFGHDHVNSFAGVYKDINLVATPAVTFYSYGNNRGVRTITLHESDLWKFDSDLFTYEDITNDSVSNIFVKNFGYYEYYHKCMPLIFAAAGFVVVIAAIAGGIAVRKKKKEK